MGVATSIPPGTSRPVRRRDQPLRSELRTLPEPPERLDAHGWTGKRVREDVRDGLAVLAFSLLTSSAVVSVLFLLLHFAG